MSHALLATPAHDAIPQEKSAGPLTALTEKLGELRFFIILTARWESSNDVDREERSVMRSDLLRLRKQYSDKIDEIAMSFGVQQAMNAQREVEHSIHVPAEIRPSSCMDLIDDDEDPQI